MDTAPTSPKPHMLAIDFEHHPGDFGVTAIVLVDAPEGALERPSTCSRNTGK